eukprot:SAG22_NODE_536_length_9364_cov_15.973988_13_plen_118_part_00
MAAELRQTVRTLVTACAERTAAELATATELVTAFIRDPAEAAAKVAALPGAAAAQNGSAGGGGGGDAEYLRQLAVGQMFAMHAFRTLDGGEVAHGSEDEERAEKFVHAAADWSGSLV